MSIFSWDIFSISIWVSLIYYPIFLFMPNTINLLFKKNLLTEKDLAQLMNASEFNLILEGETFHRVNPELQIDKQISMLQTEFIKVQSQENNISGIDYLYENIISAKIKFQYFPANLLTKKIYEQLKNKILIKLKNKDKSYEIELYNDLKLSKCKRTNLFQREFLIKNEKSHFFVSLFWYCFFTLVLPMGAFYATYLYFITKRETIVISKLITIAEPNLYLEHINSETKENSKRNSSLVNRTSMPSNHKNQEKFVNRKRKNKSQGKIILKNLKLSLQNNSEYFKESDKDSNSNNTKSLKNNKNKIHDNNNNNSSVESEQNLK